MRDGVLVGLPTFGIDLAVITLNVTRNVFPHALACLLQCVDESVEDVNGWMTANLDADARLDAEMVWNRRVKRETA